MDKQELIDYCNAIKENKSQIINCIDVNRIIKKIEQLDESKKVTVPQFVADWYEENKDDFERNLFRSINTISSMYEDEELNEFEDWVIGAYTKPFQTLVNMHQFGYELEKEKRYSVKLKGAVSSYLNYDVLNDWWFLNKKYNGLTVHTHHTRKHLEEAGFGEVFNSPLFDVEEVEE